MQAASQNQLAAYYMGIPVKQINGLVWGLAAAVAAVAGLLLAPITFVHANMGFIGLKAFPAAVVGGFGSLPGAIVGAFSYAETVLIERFVVGTEVAVTVLDGRALPPVEISPKDGGRYDFAARYTAGATEFHAPARLPSQTLAACERTAIEAGRAIGTRHLWRADMIVDDAGVPWLLEIDTCPGMTETSLAPLAAEAAGIGFSELCGTLVALAAPGAARDGAAE
jgi:D-alanine-D-alanine ligase